MKLYSSGKLELLDAVSTSDGNVTIKAFPTNSDYLWKEYPHTCLVYFTKEKTFHVSYYHTECLPFSTAKLFML